jgi:hypothetical protein
VVVAVGVCLGQLGPLVHPAAGRVGPHVGDRSPDPFDLVERNAELLELMGAVFEHGRGVDVVGVHVVQLLTFAK